MASLAAKFLGPAMPRYGGPADAARLAGLSTKTVRRRIAAGAVPSYRVGRRVLVAFADVDRFIRSRRVSTMSVAHPETPPLFDPKTGRRRPLSAEERRAHSEALRRALEVNATIVGETDTDEVWDRVERLLAGRA